MTTNNTTAKITGARKHAPLTAAERKAAQERRDRAAGLHLVRVKVPAHQVAAVRAFARSLNECAQ